MNVERSIRGLETLHRRVATLMFLSGAVPAPRFSEPLARCLHAATGASVALVRFTDAANSTNLNGRLLEGSGLGDGFQLPSQLPQNEAGFASVS